MAEFKTDWRLVENKLGNGSTEYSIQYRVQFTSWLARLVCPGFWETRLNLYDCPEEARERFEALKGEEPVSHRVIA